MANIQQQAGRGLRQGEMTAAQRAALLSFAKNEGRTWKATLRNAWRTGRYPAHVTADIDTSSLLQQIRNRLGPSWLDRVTVENLETEEGQRTIHEANRRLQARYDTAHARAYALDNLAVNEVQRRFEDGEADIHEFEAALHAAEHADPSGGSGSTA